MTKHFALAGANKIWITGRAMAALEETRDELLKLVPDCEVCPFTADLLSPSDVTRLFDSLSGEVPDILLNNAGCLTFTQAGWRHRSARVVDHFRGQSPWPLSRHSGLAPSSQRQAGSSREYLILHV